MTDREMAAQLEERGWGTIPPERYAIDVEKPFLGLWESVKGYTMTGLERGYALYKAVEYLCRNRIPGDFVECGVWKGGSSMLMAFSLLEFGDSSRRLYLYDTYAGMTEPTEEDVIAWNGLSVCERRRAEQRKSKDSFSSWAIGMEEVASNMRTTGYPQEQIRYVAGDVCETLKTGAPRKVALLRLDTDWYASTRAELELLYPRLVCGGVLIIDDYGHFAGARQAVDEYFKNLGYLPYLSRVDYTARVMVKQ